MFDLPSELDMQCFEVFRQCNEFNSDELLRAVFTTDDLAPFADSLPSKSRSNKREFVTIVKSFLLATSLADGRWLLLPFLDALRGRYPQEDALHCELNCLYQRVLAQASIPTSTTYGHSEGPRSPQTPLRTEARRVADAIIEAKPELERSDESGLKQFILNFTPGVAIGIIVLVVEYWTGLFQAITTPASSPTINGLVFTINMFAFVCCLIFFFRCVWIWSKPYRYVREEFALPAVLTGTFTISVGIISSLSGLTPWYMFKTIWLKVLGQSTSIAQLAIGDWIAMVSLGLLVVFWLEGKYRSWNGLRSELEFIRQMRGSHISLLFDAKTELSRLKNRQPPLKVYVEPSPEFTFEVRDPSLRSRVWKEQALELLQLSSTNYRFDLAHGWHEPPGCWIGRNRAGEQVILYPLQDMPTDDELKSMLSYVDRLQNQSGQRRSEILVMTRGEIKQEERQLNGRTVYIISEKSMIDKLLNLDEYREEIRRRVEEDSLPESTLTPGDVYVRPQCTIVDKHNTDDFEAYLLRWLDEPGQRQLVLLGEYGQGKSTAALMFTYKLLSQSGQIPTRVPILIELRGTSPVTNRLELGVLGDWSASYGLNPKLLRYMNEAGRLLLIFEGFDEISLLGDADMRRRHFARLWGFATPRAKILFTGRPNLFRGKDEMEQALGLSKPLGVLTYCEAMRLSFFTIEQISEALRNHPPHVRKQVCEFARHNPHFRDLVARPSLLHIVAVLWEQEQLASKINQLNSAYILDLFVRKSYRRPGRQDDPESEYMILNSNERAYFMHGIATYMVSRKLQNQIDARQLDRVIDELLPAIPHSVSRSVPATSNETTTPLMLRFTEAQTIQQRAQRGQLEGISRQIRDQVKDDVRTCGLLVDDPAAPGTFRFGYKLFMEFLFAVIAADQYKSEDIYQAQQARAILRVTGAEIGDVLHPSMTACPDFFAETLIADELNALQRKTPNVRIENNVQQRLLAEKLLQVVTNENKPVGKWIWLFTLTAILCKNRRRLYLLGLLPCLLLTVPSMAAFFLDINIARRTMSQTPIIAIYSTLRPTIYLIGLFGLIWYFGLFFLASNRRRLRLWNRLCKRLNIPDAIMHQVFGTYRFLCDKNRPFDYFEAYVLPGQEAGASTPPNGSAVAP